MLDALSVLPTKGADPCNALVELDDRLSSIPEDVHHPVDRRCDPYVARDQARERGAQFLALPLDEAVEPTVELLDLVVNGGHAALELIGRDLALAEVAFQFGHLPSEFIGPLGDLSEFIGELPLCLLPLCEFSVQAVKFLAVLLLRHAAALEVLVEFGEFLVGAINARGHVGKLLLQALRPCGKVSQHPALPDGLKSGLCHLVTEPKLPLGEFPKVVAQLPRGGR